MHLLLGPHQHAPTKWQILCSSRPYRVNGLQKVASESS